MEAGFPNSLYLDDYVARGEGSAEEAHRRLDTWPYEEMRTLIDWMRAYNLENAGQYRILHYFGYDCAFRSWHEAIGLIAEYLQVVDTTAVAWITELLNNYTVLDAELVLDYFVSNAEKFIEKSTDAAYRLNLRIVQNLMPSWTVWHNLENRLPDLAIRDEFNYGNVNWIINNLLDGGKVIIWAHNGHVGNTILNDGQGGPAQMLGHRLKAQLGDDYYTIATEFYAGQFLAWDICPGHEYAFVTHDAALPFEGCYAFRFHQEGIPLFFLDLREIDYSLEEAAWLAGSLQLRHIGASYCTDKDWPYHYRRISLPDEYDGIIYFEDTSPVTPVSFTP